MELDAVHPDLWAKIAELDKTCTIHFQRVGEPRRWEFVIERDGERIAMEDMTLVRAMTAALLAAQSRGWH